MADPEENFVQSTDQFLNSLYAQVEEFVQNNSEEETLGEVLVFFHGFKSDFGAIYDLLANALSDSMGQDGEILLPDGTKIEKKWASTRRGWQHKDLARVVSNRIAEMSVDMDTGEVVMSSEEMISKMLDYVQPSYWKAKPVSSLGIDVDNYCESGEVKTSIIVRRNNA